MVKKYCRIKLIVVLTAVLLCLVSGTVIAQMAEAEHSFGFGLGLPYGGLGVNYELGATDYFACTIGLGRVPDNIAWNVGIRLYYPGREAKFRGRTTFLCGTNLVLETQHWYGSEYKTEEGLSTGIGFSWRFGKKWAFDADLFHIDANIPAGYEEQGPDTKISLGFSMRF
jgi:hypothetical protein